MRLSLRIPCVLACFFLSFSAAAIPITWSLVGVTFTDGGTASGTFVYDADTNTYSNVNITTTAGSVILTGATLQFVAPGLAPNSSQVLTVASNAADLTGARGFALFFTPGLTNAGGTHSLDGQEASCANATCANPAPPARFTSGGAVTALTYAVPTLSTWAKIATGLLLVAAAFVALRRLGL